MLAEGRLMGWIIMACQNAGMDPGVQCLDTTVQDFRKTRMIGHLREREPRLDQCLAGPSGRKQLDSELGQTGGEFDQALLIGDTEESVLNLHRIPFL